MNLKEVRALFLEASGRLDLVNPDGGNAGADRFINAGQRFLDSRQDTPKSVARVIRPMPPGSARIVFRDCRAIKEVWVANAEGRRELEMLPINSFRKLYPSLLVSSEAVPPVLTVTAPRGAPLHYAKAIVGLASEQEFLSQAAFEAAAGSSLKYGYGDVVPGDHYAYRSVLVAPVPETEMTIEVWGHFWSRWLERDTDQSYWTTMMPDTLLAAAMWKVECFYRNEAGARSWLEMIAQNLSGTDKDLVEDDGGTGELLDMRG